MSFADQGDLFGGTREPSCARADLGTCPGPCAARCTGPEYREGVLRAIRFLSGEDDSLLLSLKGRMDEAASRHEFEQAAMYRDRAARFEGLRDEIVLFRQALAGLSFVYRVPSMPTGEDRGYVIHRGRVASSFSFATEPGRLEDRVRDALAQPAPNHADDSAREEAFLVARWFRLRPDELARTSPFDPVEASARNRGSPSCTQEGPAGEAGGGFVEVTNRMAET
jgi:excinuclease ABC subunit C